ncbi:hypothetical protein FACS189490_03030 [Clostridia bacterium]|nr:hypothetical protein FACS189490_03030 [Clostridia bacterium]
MKLICKDAINKRDILIDTNYATIEVRPYSGKVFVLHTDKTDELRKGTKEEMRQLFDKIVDAEKRGDKFLEI